MSNRRAGFLPSAHNGLPIFLGLLGVAGLYAISRYNFLLFHSLSEAFSIIIAIAVFAIFWNTRHLLESGLYLVIGFGCLFAGLFDLIYIFAYPGMAVFPGADGNLALQAKTVAQWYVSLSCISAFFFLRRKVNQRLALSVYSTISVLALLSIFYWQVFPDCYVEGVGITPFERFGLMISSIAYLGAFVLLIRNRDEFDRVVFKFLAITLLAFLVQDTLSAVGTELQGLARTIAHLCQVVALFFVYKAFVEVGLRKPYDLLFRNQQQSAEALERHERFLETVLENAYSAIAACDAKGVLTLLNRAARELYGLPEEPIPAERWAEYYDLYHADGKTPMRMEEIPLYRALQGEHIRDVEITIAPKMRPSRTFVVNGEPLIGKDGSNQGAVIAMHDITQRKRDEEELKRANETLEQRASQLRSLASELTLAEQRERRRLAQVLHDQLQQLLVAAKMQVNLTGRKTTHAAIIRSLEKIDELLDQIIAESRSLTLELSPPVLFDRGLVGGLEWLARRFLEQHQLPVSLVLDTNAEPAGEATRIFLFQAARELLFNTVKHAHAQSAQIRLERLNEERLRLVVADDGRGFDPSIINGSNPKGGFGLFSLRERLESIGGRLEARSAPGAGTQMVIEAVGGWPVLAAEATPLWPQRPGRLGRADQEGNG